MCFKLKQLKKFVGLQVFYQFFRKSTDEIPVTDYKHTECMNFNYEQRSNNMGDKSPKDRDKQKKQHDKQKDTNSKHHKHDERIKNDQGAPVKTIAADNHNLKKAG